MDQGSSRALAAGAAPPRQLEAWLDAAAGALGSVHNAHSWDAKTRQWLLGELDRVIGAVTVARARLVTAEAKAGTWGLKGDRDLAGFLGRTSRQGRGAGAALVGQAATLAAMPAVADAVADGPVTARHLAEITRATGQSPQLAAELATSVGQGQVVELARQFDGVRFGKQLDRMAAELEPASRQQSHDEQRAARYLHVSFGPGGTHIKGFFDAVAGYKFGKVLEALSPRPAADDDRDRGQRNADALGVMMDRMLADKETTPGALAPVQALITLSEDTWRALRAARDAEGPAVSTPSRGSAGDVMAGLRGVPAVEDEAGRPWPASEIARSLCDCQLTRVVMDAAGQVLDLGRGQRLFSKAQWLALYAAGVTTCVYPDCGMPLRYTELHHLRWWDRDDGPSDLVNAGPECSFHHHEIHRRDIRVTRLPDGRYEHRHRDGRLIGIGGPPLRPEPGSPSRSDSAPPSRSESTSPRRSDSASPTRPEPGSPPSTRPPGRPAGDRVRDRTGSGVAPPVAMKVAVEQPALWSG